VFSTFCLNPGNVFLIWGFLSRFIERQNQVNVNACKMSSDLRSINLLKNPQIKNTLPGFKQKVEKTYLPP
jgi:hypothetical protein